MKIPWWTEDLNVEGTLIKLPPKLKTILMATIKVSRFTNLTVKNKLVYHTLWSHLYRVSKIKIKPVSDVRSHNCVYLDGLIPANFVPGVFRNVGLRRYNIIYLFIIVSKGTRNLWINQRCRKNSSTDTHNIKKLWEKWK